MRLGAYRTRKRETHPLADAKTRRRFLADVEHLAEAADAAVNQMRRHGLDARPLAHALHRLGGA